MYRSTSQNESFSASCTRRGLFTVELTAPKPIALMSAMGEPYWGWLKRLKNSARKLSPDSLQGKAKSLMMEKSELTKSGPTTGTRAALPSSPAAGAAKQVALIH